MFILALLLALFLICPGVVYSQELSTIVFPSEDELAESLALSEIDYQQYQSLKDIAIAGIESDSRYLLDEIPNLSYFQTATNSFALPLNSEQEQSFNRRGGQNRNIPISGRIGYRFIQRLDESARSWYRSSAAIGFGRHYHLDLKINRESNGHERVVSRSVSYSSRTRFVRRLVLGNFNARFGLGTMFGYRGKLLDHSDQIDSESWLFPDYGGFNGLYMRAKSSSLEIQSIASLARDADHKLLSLGTSVRRYGGTVRPGIMLGLNQLDARHGSGSFSQPMIGINTEFHYHNGYSVAELSRLGTDYGAAFAAVIEGRHHFGEAELRYAGWSYGEDYVDLTGGSKAANLRQSQEISSVDLNSTTKRAGQDGLLIRTVIELAGNAKLSSSLMYASSNRGKATRQISAALIRRVNDKLLLQLDILNRWHRQNWTDPADRADNRIRMEGRFDSGRLSLRSYVAYNSKTARRRSVSFLTSAKYDLPQDATVQLWSNFGRIDSDGVEYWYVYVRASQNLSRKLQAALKMAHSYNRDAATSGRATISFELNATV